MDRLSLRAGCNDEVSDDVTAWKEGEPWLLECALAERETMVDRDGSVVRSSKVAARVDSDLASRAPMTGLVEGTGFALAREGRSFARLSRSPSTLSNAPTHCWPEDAWQSPGSSSMSKRGDLRRYVLSDIPFQSWVKQIDLIDVEKLC